MTLLQTPFHDYHLRQGARMVDFAGWEMPILYRSILDEHRQVRHSAGLFDVSHMGRLWLTGSGARRLLERTLTRRVSDMEPGRCRYSLVCDERGGVIDDVIVYRFDDRWMIVVNASNRLAVVEHLAAHRDGLTVDVEDRTLSTAMIALQGPRVMELILDVSEEVPSLKRYAFCEKDLVVAPLLISRTGYTGEDGVEVIMPVNACEQMLNLLESHTLEGGTLAPIGLGARDTLRLEAGMPLYGHELNRDTDPLSAGLAFAVSLDKDQAERGEPFVGQAALREIAARGPRRRLVGLMLEGRRTARQGAAVTRDGQTVGVVTSGCMSPTLGQPLAMAYVEAAQAEVGTRLDAAVGSASSPCRVVPLPFYKRP